MGGGRVPFQPGGGLAAVPVPLRPREALGDVPVPITPGRGSGLSQSPSSPGEDLGGWRWGFGGCPGPFPAPESALWLSLSPSSPEGFGGCPGHFPARGGDGGLSPSLSQPREDLGVISAPLQPREDLGALPIPFQPWSPFPDQPRKPDTPPQHPPACQPGDRIVTAASKFSLLLLFGTRSHHPFVGAHPLPSFVGSRGGPATGMTHAPGRGDAEGRRGHRFY